MGEAKRILIIDDAMFQSEILKEIFKNEFGFNVEVEISDGFEVAEKLILEKDFDLILIDYILGISITAVEVKRKLISATETLAKWALLSGLDISSLQEQHSEEGFDCFIHKGDYLLVTESVRSQLYPK